MSTQRILMMYPPRECGHVSAGVLGLDRHLDGRGVVRLTIDALTNEVVNERLTWRAP